MLSFTTLQNRRNVDRRVRVHLIGFTTPGTLTLLVGHAGAGKSFTVVALMASFVAPFDNFGPPLDFQFSAPHAGCTGRFAFLLETEGRQQSYLERFENNNISCKYMAPLPRPKGGLTSGWALPFRGGALPRGGL